jgi:hypothetical protein
MVAMPTVKYKAVTDQLWALYPSDRARKTALALCVAEDHQFNRAWADARAACYDKWLPIFSKTSQSALK